VRTDESGADVGEVTAVFDDVTRVEVPPPLHAPMRAAAVTTSESEAVARERNAAGWLMS